MSLEKMLNARSVAIIGASRDEKKRGFQAVRALIESKYEGSIYPVNPREESILGHCAATAVFSTSRSPVDLALITTPAETLESILDECGRKGVAGVVVVAGGFGEMGRKGKQLQDKIVDIASEAPRCVFLGPNTNGMINVHSGLNLVGLNDVPKGDLALISQSGNMALHIITEARLKSQKGFSYYVGVGNEADIKFHEYLEFFTADPKTRAIVMYVEGMSDGRRFLQQAYQTTAKSLLFFSRAGGRQRAVNRSALIRELWPGFPRYRARLLRGPASSLIENSDELFPVAEALSSLPPIPQSPCGHSRRRWRSCNHRGRRAERPRHQHSRSLTKTTREKLAKVL